MAAARVVQGGGPGAKRPTVQIEMMRNGYVMKLFRVGDVEPSEIYVAATKLPVTLNRKAKKFFVDELGGPPDAPEPGRTWKP